MFHTVFLVGSFIYLILIFLSPGSSIKEWAGKNMEDCTFEDVSTFLSSFTDSNWETVELVVKECR